jgi:hypothetical protein
VEHAVREGRDIGFVRDQHDRIPSAVKPIEDTQDLRAGFRVET